MKKKCSKCKEVKDFSLFYNNRHHKDKKQSNCKVCCDKATRKWRTTTGKTKYQTYSKSPEAYEAHKKRNKARSQHYRDNLFPCYVRELICKRNTELMAEDITDEMVEIWTVALKLRRLLRKEK